MSRLINAEKEEAAGELCPKCGQPMPKTERYYPFRSTFYNCPSCFPELESTRAQIKRDNKSKSGRVFEVVRQNKPSLLFPDEPVSKQKTKVAAFGAEQEARDFAIDDELSHYEVRERVFRWVRKSGFTREGIPVHNIEVRETISLKTLN